MISLCWGYITPHEAKTTATQENKTVIVPTGSQIPTSTTPISAPTYFVHNRTCRSSANARVLQSIPVVTPAGADKNIWMSSLMTYQASFHLMQLLTGLVKKTGAIQLCYSR